MESYFSAKPQREKHSEFQFVCPIEQGSTPGGLHDVINSAYCKLLFV